MVGGKNVVVVKRVMDLGSRIGDGCVQGRSDVVFKDVVVVGGKNVVVVKRVMDLGSRIGDGCVQGRSDGWGKGVIG
jgi:predicted thioesterase